MKLKTACSQNFPHSRNAIVLSNPSAKSRGSWRF